uniref:Uncharacterized protein n=1 Tax=Picea sitchensis TaxID=3332 RepID=A9P0G3_PICSI|nr:unknown [Picea sitchensis]
MAASPGHQMPANSFHVIKTQIAVLLLAPFSPGRDLKRLIYSTRHRHTKAPRTFIIPRRGAGFESQEPASPKVGCLGQIKLKKKWANASKHRVEKKPRAKGKLSKLWKFIFGSHGGGGGGDCGEGSGVCSTGEGGKSPYHTLGKAVRRPTPSGWLSD